MKKLIIAVVAIALGVGAQAATFSWKWTSTLNNPNSSAYSGTVYLFNANDVSRQAMLTAFLANPGSFDGTYASQSITSRATTDGKGSSSLSIPSGDIGTLRTDSSVDPAVDYVDYFYAATFTSGEDKYVFITDVYSAGVNAAQDTSLSKTLGGSTVAPDNTTSLLSGKVWYAAPDAVPEPTAGLLVLLGVAGLALKRKQA